MGQSRCFSPVRGRAMRVTRLDGCGRPVYGDESVAVSDGFVSVSFTANTDEGEEINVTNAAGKTCVRDAPCPTFLGYGVEVEFCSVDPSLFAMMTGQNTVTDWQGVNSGFRVNSEVSACESGFALELWTGVPGVACDASTSADAEPGGYLLLPYLQGGVFGDFTVENGAISFTVTGANTKTGSGWGVGPYNVVSTGASSTGPLLTPITSGDHLHVEYTDVAPPPAYCGTAPLLDPSAPALTAVATTIDGMSVEFSATPTGSDPWYVDFGDGTWDYSAMGDPIDHTYTTPGTYTVTAYRGSSSVTAEVTVSNAPTVDAITPDSGSTAGGDDVTITGTNLDKVTSVAFGVTAGTGFSVDSPTQVTVTTPPAAAGPVDVSLTYPGGSVLVADGFTYA